MLTFIIWVFVGIIAMLYIVLGPETNEREIR
jgi:hypothetical protein